MTKTGPDDVETLDGTSKPCVIRSIGWNNVAPGKHSESKGPQLLSSSHEKAFVEKIVVPNRTYEKGPKGLSPEAQVGGKEEFR